MSVSSYRTMLFTSRVKCWDGVVRTFEHAGYFTSTTVLRHRLATWNGQMGPAGEPYQYFETTQQAVHNDGTCCIPDRLLPAWKCLWHGPCQHHYEFREPKR